MKRTFIDVVAECYREREDDWGPELGTDSETEVAANYWPAGLGIRKLLIVDDEPNIRSAYQRIFARHGFHALTAANAAEAKDILVREQIGIVFLDINMAEVDGGILFELIQTFHPEVKVIVSSVYPIEEQQERVKGADAYFDKSDGKDVLVAMTSAIMAGAGGVDAY